MRLLGDEGPARAGPLANICARHGWPVPAPEGSHEGTAPIIREALAALPYPDKLRRLLQLQQMTGAIRQTRGAPCRAWLLDPDTLKPTARRGPDPEG